MTAVNGDCLLDRAGGFLLVFYSGCVLSPHILLRVNGCFLLLSPSTPSLDQTCVCAVLGAPRVVQTVSFSHSQCLLLTAVSASFLMVCPLTPTSFRSLMVELATNPLHPVSTDRTNTFQPRSTASAFYPFECLINGLFPW